MLDKKVILKSPKASGKAIIGKVIGTSAKGRLIAVEFEDGTIQVDIRAEEIEVLS